MKSELKVNRICKICDCIRPFSKSKPGDICNNIHLFGFSFFGGTKFYSFRELLVQKGIKKQAIILKCSVCSTKITVCPFCKENISIKIEPSEKCPRCKKSFYICV